MNAPHSPAALADVQGSPDTRKLAIDKVGIKSIRHPVVIADKTQGAQHTVAVFDMYVYLPQQYKGTHMSRFVHLLNSRGQAVSVASFEGLLREMVDKLEAHAGRVEMRFPYFVNKTAPVSGVQSLMDYDVTLIGEIADGRFTQTLKVLVPATSLCPCSKEISLYGAHNQRSHVTITAQTQGEVWIEDLIRMAEEEASCEVFGLLKRADEKYVTELAYDNPKFVEDMVRDVAARLNADARVLAYEVEVENFESIHNHSAYAVIERDKRLA